MDETLYDQLMRLKRERDEVKEAMRKEAQKQYRDHEPRCDCGHLFEICCHPNCF